MRVIDPMRPEHIPTIISVGGTIGVALLTFLQQRSKQRSDLTLSERDAFAKEQADFRGQLRQEITDLRAELDETREDLRKARQETHDLRLDYQRQMRDLRAQLEKMERYADTLRAKMRQAGIDPGPPWWETNGNGQGGGSGGSR